MNCVISISLLPKTVKSSKVLFSFTVSFFFLINELEEKKTVSSSVSSFSLIKTVLQKILINSLVVGSSVLSSKAFCIPPLQSTQSINNLSVKLSICSVKSSGIYPATKEFCKSAKSFKSVIKSEPVSSKYLIACFKIIYSPFSSLNFFLP